MIRIFRVHVPIPLLALGLADGALLYSVIGFSLGLSRGLGGMFPALTWELFPEKAIFLTSVLGCAFMMGVYNREFLDNIRALGNRILVAVGLSFLMLTVIFYVLPMNRIWMSALLPAMFASTCWLLASRYYFRKLVSLALLSPRVLVLGAGSVASRIEAIEMLARSHCFTCVGFVPIGPGQPCVDRQRLLNVEDVGTICEEQRVDEIVVALDEGRNAFPVEPLLECGFRGVRITMMASFVERELGQVDIDNLDSNWLIFSDGGSRRIIARILKRCLDIGLSVALLVFTLPTTLVVALAIYLEDGLPIFYRQERTGLRGKTFSMLKFRSMCRDAERDGVARWAAVADPRVTRVGAFIRKARLDEIPQVCNVLKGDMSFVGPRPERPSLIERISCEIPYYKYRHMVKPGITGWAQINYGYSDSIATAREKLKFDLYYVKNFGVFLDLIILLQTARVILWPSGAR
ncbi:MAG TPA: TIGR03013 family XrtA/PEP-CTERM system glycosyltransferase [Alphaproteobacteria bacterium]|nr:TIGR03013 family XrtA/PEP-CTERM system glycosyltransferase [Alphaproteobacteria bacterium]